LCAVAFALLGSNSLAANTISFSGSLRSDATLIACGPGCILGAGSSDNDFAQWAAVVRNLHIATPSTLRAVTFSYGGGTNAQGVVVREGGFEPYLSLFNSAGIFLASTFFGTLCPGGTRINTNTGQCLDVLLDAGTLAAGNYEIVVSAFQNLSVAENQGSGTLASGMTGFGALAPGEDLRYAVDVTLNSQTTFVPEAAPDLWLIPALAGFYFLNRKQKGNAL
jgi:hypothetical protein